MTRDDELQGIPGYVSIKEAAKLLGISEPRMYGYVRKKRIPSRRFNNTIAINPEDIEHFKLNPPGRSYKKAPDWRTYNTRSKLLGTDIQVQVRAGQQEAFIKKMKSIYKEQHYTFTGTIARYVLKDRTAPDTVSIWLVWKDNEMPDEAARQQELEAFKAELADVLDWETARYSEKEGIIYT